MTAAITLGIERICLNFRPPIFCRHCACQTSDRSGDHQNRIPEMGAAQMAIAEGQGKQNDSFFVRVIAVK